MQQEHIEKEEGREEEGVRSGGIMKWVRKCQRSVWRALDFDCMFLACRQAARKREREWESVGEGGT